MDVSRSKIRIILSHAIKEMKGKSYDIAISWLRKAFGAVTTATATVANDDDRDLNFTETTPFQLEQFPCCQTFDESQKYFMDFNGFIIFDCAFSINGLDCDEADNTSTVDDTYLSRLLAIILYNLGLTYHLMGMQSSTRFQSCLFQRALRFYLMSLKSIDSSCKCHTGADFFLRMAAGNNMGHIYFVGGDMERGRHCTSYVSQCLDLSGHTALVNADCFRTFYMNMLSMNHGNQCSAAA